MVIPDPSEMSRADPHIDTSLRLLFVSKMELNHCEPALQLCSLPVPQRPPPPRHQGRWPLHLPSWGTTPTMQEYFKEISKRLESLAMCNYLQASLRHQHLNCPLPTSTHLPCLGLRASVLCLPHGGRPKDAGVIKCLNRILTAGLTPRQPFPVRQK